MVKTYWSRRLIAFSAVMAIGIAALLVMMRIAIRAQRFDAVLVCAGAIGLMILGGTGLAWMLGLTRIPRVTSDGLTWIRVVRRNEIDVTAMKSNVIELEEEERRARITTTVGDFTIDTDCAGYDEIVALVRKWLPKSPRP